MSNPDLFHCPLNKHTMKTFKLNPLEKFCHHFVSVRVCAVRTRLLFAAAKLLQWRLQIELFDSFVLQCVRSPRWHQFLRFWVFLLPVFAIRLFVWVFFDCSVYLSTVAESPSIVIAACSEYHIGFVCLFPRLNRSHFIFIDCKTVPL